MEIVPAGFHFVPTDEELIFYYLNPKIIDKELITPYPVIERDVYASEPWNIFNIQQDPWEIVNTYDKSDKKTAEYAIYVLTTLKMISKRRVSRTAGCGTWKGQTKCQEIKDQNMKIIGFKKMLVFETKEKGKEMDENNTHWIMHEYSVSEIVGDGDYVLCMIKRVELKETEKKRKFEDICGVHRDGFSDACPENLGAAQKVMKSQEEEYPNHRSFDDVSLLSLLDDLDLNDIDFVFDEDINPNMNALDTPTINFNAYMNGLDLPAIDTTSSNGSYDTCHGSLWEAQNIMRSQEEENPYQKSFDAIDVSPMIHDMPPSPDFFDFDGFNSDLGKNMKAYIDALNKPAVDANTRSSGPLSDIVNFGSGLLQVHKRLAFSQ